MRDVFSTWPVALKHLFKDPINLFLFILPSMIAMLLYAVLVGFVQTKGMGMAEMLISKYVISKNAGLILYYIIQGLLIFLMFILVNWTFVLCLGILAAPFNDMISARIEKKMRGGVVDPNRSNTMSAVFSRFGKTIVNECKKLVVILTFTLLASILNFVPILIPVAVVILALLMSAQYLDYSWSRHDWGAGKCFKDILGNVFTNLLSGLIFLVLIAVPFINVLVPAVATSYYTVLWNKRQLPIANA